jgi:hypothetical protein
LPCCTQRPCGERGARSRCLTGKNTFQLAIYGKGSSPLLRVPLTAAKEKGAAPALLAARKTSDDGGVLELKLIGRYKAEIPVGKRIE